MQKPVSQFLFFCFFSLPLSLAGQQNIKEITEIIFKKTNQLRQAVGKKAFLPLDSLHDLAQYHSDQMVTKGFYDHIDPEGLSPVGRAEKLGINPWRKKGNTLIGIAENIAQVPWFENVIGCGDTRSSKGIANCMVEGWKNSPSHYKNIMGDYLYLGIGIQFDEKGMGFGTQVFR